MRIAPFFYVRLDGERLPEDLAERILAPVEITEEDGKLTKIEIRFNNSDRQITDDERIRTGLELEVQWGYLGDKRTARVKGVVQKVAGFRVRVVTAYGEAHAMAMETRSRIWENVRYSDIAREIAGTWGLRARVDETDTIHEQVAQVNETDFHFLKRLAQFVSFEFSVNGEELRFQPKGFGADPVMALHYDDGDRSNLIEFDPVEENLGQPGQVQVAGVNPITKESIDVRGSNENTQREAVGPTGGRYEYSGDTGQLVAYTPAQPEVIRRVSEPVHTVEEAKERADAEFRKAEESVVKAKFRAVGDVRLRAGHVVTVSGVGKRYSGNWRILKAVHSLGNGYVVSGEIERNATAVGTVKTKAEVNPVRAEPEQEGADIRRPVIFEYSGETGRQVGVVQ